MDSLITAAALSLASGDPLGALKRVALREDPPALALRGIAMAQLGEFERARELLRRAARAFGPGEPVARARCVVAEAEVALAARDLTAQPRALSSALRVLEKHGARVNVLHGRLCIARHWLQLGQIAAAERALSDLKLTAAPPMLSATFELLMMNIGLRRLNTRLARAALERARAAAERAKIPSLSAEIERAAQALEIPAAKLFTEGKVELVRLDQVERLLKSKTLVVDACRRSVNFADTGLSLSRRPVLFALARALAEAWPSDVPRPVLMASAFDVRRPNETHRARLRVEIGRLRAKLGAHAEIRATTLGFALVPHTARNVAVLAPPIEGERAAVMALLADGAAWSTSALALALGSSQRTVQRSLSELEAAGQVRSMGRARAQRWLAQPLTGFTTTLLLPTLPTPD